MRILHNNLRRINRLVFQNKACFEKQINFMEVDRLVFQNRPCFEKQVN